MAKDPSMPFYVNDWLSSMTVTCMSLAEQGAYVRLLCHCWASQDASLPDDDTAMAAVSGLVEGWLNGGSSKLRKCFVPHPEKPGFLTNDKLYRLWQERQKWREKSSEGGRKSAESRRLHGLKGGSTTVATKPQPNGNSSSSSSSSINSPSESSAAVAAAPPRKASSRKTFEPPTIDQVAAFCRDAKLVIDAAAFWDHYAANGWKQSNGRPIVDWQAAARGWARRQVQFAERQSRGPGFSAAASSAATALLPTWRPTEPRPAPTFELADIQTAGEFLQKARSQPYHDGSFECDLDSLAIWRWTWRREQQNRNPKIWLSELRRNLRQLAAGQKVDDWDKIIDSDRTFAAETIRATTTPECRPELPASATAESVGSRGAA